MDPLKITECFGAIDEDPYEKQNYLNLISVLSGDKELMSDELYQTRNSMANLFYLSEEEWQGWIADEMGDSGRLKSIFELKLLDSYSISDVWCQFLDLIVGDTDFENFLKTAINATRFDFLDNHRVISKAINYYEINQPDQLKLALLSYLQVPHMQIDDTFNYYSSYISQHDLPHYNQEMNDAKAVYNTTRKFLDFIEHKEIQIKNGDRSVEMWISYLQMSGNKQFRQVPILMSIFERAVYNKQTDDFIPVWTTIVDILYELNAPNKTIGDLLTRFIKRYPTNCTSWSKYISHLDDIEGFNSARERILLMKLLPLKEVSYKDKLPLLVSMIGFVFRSNQYQEFARDLDFYFNFSLKQNDSASVVELLIIDGYMMVGDHEKVRGLIAKLTNDGFHGKYLDVWVSCLRHIINFDDLKYIFKFLKDAVMTSRDVDQPKRVILEVERYMLLHYDAYASSKLFKLIQRVNINTPVENTSKRRLSEEVDEMVVEEDVKKSRNQDIKTRDREHLTVLVKNLPNDVKQSQLESFFQGCDPINNINLKHLDDNTEASIEFGSTQAMLALLTKNFKKLGTHQLSVEQAFNTTVWVTNFPPQVDKTWLETTFSQYGDVISVRLPSLKNNVTRRFCYVEYSNTADASNAVLELDGRDFEGYKLVVKISNPDNKQQRSNATEEQREVYICKIDFYKTTLERIQQVFAKYGDIEKVNLPLSHKNQKLGRQHDGYGFVTFTSAEEATHSLELDGTNLDGRIIEVSIAQLRSKTRTIIKNESNAENTKDIITSKTVTISNLPDTLNAQRLQSILSEYGPIRKIDLNTEYHSALVEFENVSDAGVLSMKLSGTQIDGNVIDIGARRSTGEKHKVVDALPGLNRRQRRLLLQKQQQETKPETKSETKLDDTRAGGLSNNDFKAMLLGGKK